MPTKAEKDNFSQLIEETAAKEGISHMEAITDYCVKTGLEIEVAASLINPILKGRIELEARNLRYLTKESTLPV